jgi:hypothetical protein
VYEEARGVGLGVLETVWYRPFLPYRINIVGAVTAGVKQACTVGQFLVKR